MIKVPEIKWNFDDDWKLLLYSHKQFWTPRELGLTAIYEGKVRASKILVGERLPMAYNYADWHSRGNDLLREKAWAFISQEIALGRAENGESIYNNAPNLRNTESGY